MEEPMRKLLCLSSFILTILAYPAPAADLPRKALDVAPVPPPAIYNPFWIGIEGGAGFTDAQNEFAIAGNSTGAIKGFPTGALVGPSLGYTANAGGLIYGFAVNAYYNFDKGCVGLACTMTRKNNFLLEQALEVGINLSTLNGLQPIPLPAPGGLPVSMWSATYLMLRGGAAEQNINLCVFDAVTGDTPCGNSFIAAPFAGLKFQFAVTQNSTIGAKWDHIFWGSKNQQSVFEFVPLNSIPIFSNVATAKSQDLFTFAWQYHLN
jgi:hypothetical protein